MSLGCVRNFDQSRRWLVISQSSVRSTFGRRLWSAPREPISNVVVMLAMFTSGASAPGSSSAVRAPPGERESVQPRAAMDSSAGACSLNRRIEPSSPTRFPRRSRLRKSGSGLLKTKLGFNP
jgi:hypothetical protein